GETPIGLFAIGDEVRPDAAASIVALTALGVKAVMVTGDNPVAANAMAKAVGIGAVEAGILPEGKAAIVSRYQSDGLVAMVGDGVNDAPALAEADVGIAIGTGADVALETADFALLRPEPMLVADALHLSRKIWSTLRQGLFWAMIYNLVGIPLAAFGVLSPMVAGAAMAASSVCVLGNALRLTRWRPA
ncbi:MAG: HAD-IC family P-type ATPase, partial [Acidocella sp.]|nr:HAD-IC family P-type ATPase [Acidocella sp.]